MVIDNTIDGFDLHSLDTGGHIRQFLMLDPPTDEQFTLTRHVAFGEKGKIVVCGGQDKISVFECSTGNCLDTLRHEPLTPGCQTITVMFHSIPSTLSSRLEL